MLMVPCDCEDPTIMEVDPPTSRAPLLPLPDLEDPPGPQKKHHPTHTRFHLRVRHAGLSRGSSRPRFTICTCNQRPRPRTTPCSIRSGKIEWDVWACSYVYSKPRLHLYRSELRLPPSSSALESVNAKTPLVGKFMADIYCHPGDNTRRVEYVPNGEGGLSTISQVGGLPTLGMVFEPREGPDPVVFKRDSVEEAPKVRVVELQCVWMVWKFS